MNEAVDAPAAPARPRAQRIWLRLLPWILTLGCFYSAYYKIAHE